MSRIAVLKKHIKYLEKNIKITQRKGLSIQTLVSAKLRAIAELKRLQS